VRDYPLLNLFWTMMWFFLWIMYIFLFFRVVMDIFRSGDLGGWGKAGWVVLVIVLPFLGIFIYLIARGTKMQDRDVKAAQKADSEFQDYVRKTAGTSGGGDNVSQLAKLADLKRNGDLSQEEYDQAKARLLT
jgi:hypothetical protein